MNQKDYQDREYYAKNDMLEELIEGFLVEQLIKNGSLECCKLAAPLINTTRPQKNLCFAMFCKATADERAGLTKFFKELSSRNKAVYSLKFAEHEQQGP